MKNIKILFFISICFIHYNSNAQRNLYLHPDINSKYEAIYTLSSDGIVTDSLFSGFTQSLINTEIIEYVVLDTMNGIIKWKIRYTYLETIRKNKRKEIKYTSNNGDFLNFFSPSNALAFRVNKEFLITTNTYGKVLSAKILTKKALKGIDKKIKKIHQNLRESYKTIYHTYVNPEYMGDKFTEIFTFYPKKSILLNEEWGYTDDSLNYKKYCIFKETDSTLFISKTGNYVGSTDLPEQDSVKSTIENNTHSESIIIVNKIDGMPLSISEKISDVGKITFRKSEETHSTPVSKNSNLSIIIKRIDNE